jgi:DNA-binding transcriptional regulator YhcF (GntR family)
MMRMSIMSIMATSMTHVAEPAAAAAGSFLDRLIEHCRRQGVHLLPSVDALAAQAGVSRMTMWHALRRYRETGVVTAGRGRPIAIAGVKAALVSEAREPKAKNERRSRLQSLTRDVTRAVVEGQYLPGQLLPPMKDLCRTHGVCYRTMAASLDELRRAGYLQTRGGRYAAPVRMQQRAYKSYVVLVGYGEGGRLGLMTARAHDQVRAVEAQCAGLGLDLVILTTDLLGPRASVPPTWRAVVDRVRRFPPLGCLLWTVSLPGEQVRSVLGFARQFDIPVASLDESPRPAEFWRQQRGMRIKAFTVAVTRTAGEDVGRYLLGLGHRRVAFATMSPAPHALARHEGVKAAYAGAGCRDAVSLFMPRSVGGSSGVAGATSPGRTSLAAEAARLSEALQRISTRGMWVPADPAARGGLRAMLRKVLAAGEFSALVCDSDATAVECIDFLHENRVAIPQSVSVVGFDDSVEALVYGLTSYNFSGTAAARAMLAYVLNPGPAEGVTDVPGMVIERRTSGPAAR